MNLAFLAVPVILLAMKVVEVASAFNAQAWQSVGHMEYTFPENDYAYVASRPNNGVTFSGGGDRSYIASIGAMGAFHELGYFGNIKYIAGSSGGSWASAVYTYFQNPSVNDSVMLGPIKFPEEITYDNLYLMEPDCVRAYPNSTYFDNTVLYSGWLDAVQAIYFTPAGIGRGVPFSYNNESVADIKSRNSNLADTEFLMQRSNFNESAPGIDKRPFVIIQATMDGPFKEMPWQPANRNYSMLEWTPLTAGVTYSHDVTYNGINTIPYHEVLMIGGYIEPFAFGGSAGPSTGLPAGTNTGYLDVPITTVACDMAMASGTSSWAPGNTIAASSDYVIQRSAGSIYYWSPSYEDPQSQRTEFAVGDGAGVSNTDLISLLQRNMSSIIAFVNTDTPLQNSTHWDPLTQNLTTQIDFTVPAFFGHILDNCSKVTNASYDLVNSQVFEYDDWFPFIVALQKAQADGNGAVVNMTHTTVQNNHYGVVGGVKVNVLWFYLGTRVTNWEAQLDEEMQSYLIPAEDPYNQAVFPKVGPFRDFPGYTTTLASLNIPKLNLLADMVGWVVYQNQDLFRNALGISSTSDTTSAIPSEAPTPAVVGSTTSPSAAPTDVSVSSEPSAAPSCEPTNGPHFTGMPSIAPTVAPSSAAPTATFIPSAAPSAAVSPSISPSIEPTNSPPHETDMPSFTPTAKPTQGPHETGSPSCAPSIIPSGPPTTKSPSTVILTAMPSEVPTAAVIGTTTSPSATPSVVPTSIVLPTADTMVPSIASSAAPSLVSSFTPSTLPPIEDSPTAQPSKTPTKLSASPTTAPSSTTGTNSGGGSGDDDSFADSPAGLSVIIIASIVFCAAVAVAGYFYFKSSTSSSIKQSLMGGDDNSSRASHMGRNSATSFSHRASNGKGGFFGPTVSKNPVKLNEDSIGFNNI